MTLLSFPRGGKKLNNKSCSTFYSKNTTLRRKKQKSKFKFTNEKVQKNGNLLLTVAQNLTYSTLCDGMIVLGCIFKVTDYYAIVSLPGQISGKLQAIDVCKSYTNLLKNIADNKEISHELKTLSNLYEAGKYIICYVKEVNFQTKEVLLSTEPKLINEHLDASLLTKSSKVVLTVSSVEDHGYIMETGLTNFRAFLSVKDLQDVNIKPCIGKQLLCVVKDIKKSDHTFTATVSVKSKHLNDAESRIVSLTNLVPGTQYTLIVEKILKNGLRVYFAGKSTGYVSQFYIEQALTYFEKGQELCGTLLYFTPTTKLAYFSLLSAESKNQSIMIGDIVPKAQIIAYDSRGIFVQLDKETRGYIPFKRTGVDLEKIKSIFKLNSIHKCKTIAYDLLAKLFLCSMEQKMLTEHYPNLGDLQIGNIVKVCINSINEENGYITVTTGKTFGIVPPDQIFDAELKYDLKVGDYIRARVLDSLQKVIFTLKKSLVESKLPILSKFENAIVGRVHHGSVMKVSNQGVLVRFFGNVKGWIPNRLLSTQKISENLKLSLGQTVAVIIENINRDKKKITLSLSNTNISVETAFKIGDVIEGVVTDSSAEGAHLKIETNNNVDVMAYLPAGHISPCLEVGKIIASKTVAGEKLPVIVFSVKPNIIVSTTFVPENLYNNIHNFNRGDTILCSVVKIYKDSIKVLVPMKSSSKYVTIPINNTENIESMHENQILFAKVIQTDSENGKINLTTRFKILWADIANSEVRMMGAVDVLISYLNKILELSKNVFYTSKAISKIKIGQRIQGIVESIMSDGLVLKLEGNLKGIVRKNNFSKTYYGQEQVEATVLWINYPDEYIELSLLPIVMKNISVKQNKLAKIPIGIQLRGEIVLSTKWFILVILKGQSRGTLVTLPARRHLNDIVPDLSPYQIGSKVRCYGVLNKDDADILLPICILKSAFETHVSLDPSLESKKRKKLETTTNEKFTEAKRIRKSDDENNFKNKELIAVTEQNCTKELTWKNIVEKDVFMKLENSNLNEKDVTRTKNKKKNENMSCYTEKNSVNNNNNNNNSNEITDVDDNVDKKKTKQEYNCKKQSIKIVDSINLSIIECGFDWNNLNTNPKTNRTIDNETGAARLKKEKKTFMLTQKREIESKIERQIHEREEALARCQTPRTIDQFDRLVLSNPASSLVWMQYMAYYLQITDIEKARAVARRALKTINFREEDERLNIWQAWLNLESRFGSVESLDVVFQEASKTNNAEKICSHLLTLHLEAKRYTQIQKLIDVMVVKFKQNPSVWIDCGTALLKIGLINKSRQLMQRALQSLPEHEHINTIKKFAVLENKFGDKERSQTLFESILGKYKNRTDVWCSYVDSLVESGDLKIARKVLERAVTEVRPVKKIKVLFKKYVNFEKEHGSLANLSHVQQLAAKYYEKQSNAIS